MKKIIALVLALCCIFAIVSCNGNSGNVDEATSAKLAEVLQMFDDSIPTRAETKTTEKIGNVVLESTALLATGMMADGTKASLYEGSFQSLREVGNSLEMKVEQPESKWYIEGKGVSTDKGITFDAEAGDFAPTEGFIKLAISDSMISEAKWNEEDSTLTLTVTQEHATNVVAAYLEEGQTIDSDIVITIVTAGGRITGLKLEFSTPTHTVNVGEDGGTLEIPSTSVTIDTKYIYGLQTISFE